MVEGTTDESDASRVSPLFRTRLHAQAGTVSGLHIRLHAGARPPACRSRSATPFPRHPAFGPPDGAHPRAGRADPTTSRRRAQHRTAGQPRSSAASTCQPRSTRQILCAEVLVAAADRAFAADPPTVGPRGTGEIGAGEVGAAHIGVAQIGLAQDGLKET